MFVFHLSNLVAEAGWTAGSMIRIRAFFSSPLFLITLRVIVIMSFPDSSSDLGSDSSFFLGTTLCSHLEVSSQRCKARLSLLLLHPIHGAQGFFEKPDRTSASKRATNTSSPISVSFVGGKIVIAASPIPLKASFHQCPLSEGMLLSRRQKKASKSSHWSNSKYLFIEKLLCFCGGEEKGKWQEEKQESGGKGRKHEADLKTKKKKEKKNER